MFIVHIDVTEMIFKTSGSNKKKSEFITDFCQPYYLVFNFIKYSVDISKLAKNLIKCKFIEYFILQVFIIKYLLSYLLFYNVHSNLIISVLLQVMDFISYVL